MIEFPERWLRGAEKEAAMMTFANQVLQIDKGIDFKVSSRGWCYILEEHGLLKGDFDRAQRLINDCCKNGMLPVDFTAEDKTRSTDNLESLSWHDEVEGRARYIVSHGIDAFVSSWNPMSFWESQDYYVEVAVEKIDLVTLFQPHCNRYKVPITNFKGWSDINSRAAMMNRFQHWESEGKQCVLLYCGDHDPGGLNIADTIRKNMEDLSEADGIDDWWPDEVEIVRFGLNYDFIQKHNLSWIENLETSSGKRLDDPGHKDYWKPYVQNYLNKYGARKVEANALVTRPEAATFLILDTLTDYIDVDAKEEFEQTMEDLREELEERVMEMMREKFEAED